MLIKTVDDINVHYGYSKSTVEKMKEQIEEQLVLVLDTYSNPEDILQLMKLPDYEGRDCFWYFQQYPLFKMLGISVMDKFIQDKWTAQAECNSSILDYSCSQRLLNDDKKEEFVGEFVDIFKALSKQIFTLRKPEIHHAYKFKVWQESMQLRYMMEAVFTVLITLIF